MLSVRTSSFFIYSAGVGKTETKETTLPRSPYTCVVVNHSRCVCSFVTMSSAFSCSNRALAPNVTYGIRLAFELRCDPRGTCQSKLRATFGDDGRRKCWSNLRKGDCASEIWTNDECRHRALDVISRWLRLGHASFLPILRQLLAGDPIRCEHSTETI